MIKQVALGKWHRLRSLSDDQGRFRMLAIDQRGSLAQSIAKATGKGLDEITYEDLATVKALITKVLAPYATAVLIDPVYGCPQAYRHLPPRVGLLLATEKSRYQSAGTDGKERISFLIDDWSVEQTQYAGADAVKLLVYYRPDGSAAVRRHQEDLVQQIGQECDRRGMPFVLELLSYAVNEEGTDTAQFARNKPDLVLGSAAEFSKPQYKVDVLKLEFPADMKWTREFAHGAFDGKERTPVYTLAEVCDFCYRLNNLSGVPWVILSAGVAITEFLAQVELATEAGASGFLCGRAIWKGAINFYPDLTKVEGWLQTEGVYNIVRANAYAYRARPWFTHPRYTGRTTGAADMLEVHD